ncbi:putative inactive glycosyltransferase 25 family member 3 [Neolecta irregularis DAH-3]|uniref:Putative inactive glycosyltransferase 25 family member 3 n=1 Tax=Neolecta irregularis (strain DAH-3) TaxID=1198029 RepID=A0A1U7LGZ6_NEOID|nr:putative inactive glycosyltransferase 25 family member 3 [Neolecta irregularis DAH-3]|eukprot:OLL21801.1 putative inactive glycosyltransferase 25 family member 3 [Neolecta irregularis DAH-3]
MDFERSWISRGENVSDELKDPVTGKPSLEPVVHRRQPRNRLRRYVSASWPMFVIPTIIWVLYRLSGPSASNREFARIPYNDSTLGFDKIFVITAMPERTRFINKILSYHHLEYTFFPAFSKHSAEVNKTMEVWFPGQSDDLSLRGKAACWLSHRTLWHEALYLNLDNVLILEDDIDILLDIKPRVKRAWMQLPGTWEYFFLGACFELFQNPHVVEFDGMNPFVTRVPIIQKLSYAACMHSYGIKASLLPLIIAMTQAPPIGGVDLDAMAEPIREGDIEAYTIWPYAMVQRPQSKLHNTVIGSDGQYNGPDQFVEEDWRVEDVFLPGVGTAEKIGVAYWL